MLVPVVAQGTAIGGGVLVPVVDQGQQEDVGNGVQDDAMEVDGEQGVHQDNVVAVVQGHDQVQEIDTLEEVEGQENLELEDLVGQDNVVTLEVFEGQVQDGDQEEMDRQVQGQVDNEQVVVDRQVEGQVEEEQVVVDRQVVDQVENEQVVVDQQVEGQVENEQVVVDWQVEGQDGNQVVVDQVQDDPMLEDTTEQEESQVQPDPVVDTLVQAGDTGDPGGGGTGGNTPDMVVDRVDTVDSVDFPHSPDSQADTSDGHSAALEGAGAQVGVVEDGDSQTGAGGEVTGVKGGEGLVVGVGGTQDGSGTSLPPGQGTPAGQVGQVVQDLGADYQLLYAGALEGINIDQLERDIRSLTQSPNICMTQEIKKEVSEGSQEVESSGGDRVSASGGLPLGQGLSKVSKIPKTPPKEGWPILELTSSSSETESGGEGRGSKRKKNKQPTKPTKIHDGGSK